MAAGEHEPDIQRIVGSRFQVVRTIGQGGLGSVVEARDAMLQRTVALKVAAPQPPGQMRERAIREARAMAQVKSPHVVAVYDCVIGADDVPFLVMELIEGVSLASRLRPGQPLRLPLAVAIARQIAEGLDAIHRRGIVHGDIKPGNVLLDGEQHRVVIGDLGLAQSVGSPPVDGPDPAVLGEHKRERLLGTPSYISPEAVAGQPLDQRADLYSLGAVFYELLTGHLPFVGVGLHEVLSARLRTDPRPPRDFNSDIPVELELVVLRLMNREPTGRFASVRAFLDSLEALTGFFQLGTSAASLSAWLMQGGAPASMSPPPLSRSGRAISRESSAPEVESRSKPGLSIDVAPGPTPESTPGPTPESTPEPTNAIPEEVPHREPSADVFAGTQPLPELFGETMDIPYTASVTGERTGDDQGRARLFIVTESEQREVVLGDDVIVGRAPSCDIVLYEQSTSRQHFAIRLYEDYYLEDLGSRNGTLVNSERVRLIRLNDRDQIAVGTVRMLFVRPLSGEHEVAARDRLREFDELWSTRFASPDANPDANPDNSLDDDRSPTLHDFAERFTNGLLRQALGLRVERAIPPYRGISGYMVEAHLLWIRQARFPILYVPVTESLTLKDIIHQLTASGSAEFLALLVAVPHERGRGKAASELTRLVAESVFRYDLAVIDHADLRRIVRINDALTLVEILLDKGIERSRLSPYVVRGPVPGNMFFGREAEIKQLSHNVRNHAVVGGRRMGKSSMFLHLRRLLGAHPRFVPYYVNCEACFDYDDFLFTINSVMEPEDEFESVTELRRGLAHMAKEQEGRSFVFLLDEVDELLSHDEQAQTRGRLFKILRALSHEQIAHFIFSGGRTLYNALHDAHSPFFNFCNDVKLYPLNRRRVAEIVLQPMRQLSIAIEKEEAIVDRIFTVTSGHPNLVQYICHCLVTGYVDRRVTNALVDEVINSQEFAEHYVETAWSQTTPLEKLITLVPEDTVFPRIWLVDRLREYGVTDLRAIESALRTLELYALVRPDGDQLEFVLSYFPHAVRRLDLDRQIAAQLVELESP